MRNLQWDMIRRLLCQRLIVTFLLTAPACIGLPSKQSVPDISTPKESQGRSSQWLFSCWCNRNGLRHAATLLWFREMTAFLLPLHSSWQQVYDVQISSYPPGRQMLCLLWQWRFGRCGCWIHRQSCRILQFHLGAIHFFFSLQSSYSQCT